MLYYIYHAKINDFIIYFDDSYLYKLNVYNNEIIDNKYIYNNSNEIITKVINWLDEYFYNLKPIIPNDLFQIEGSVFKKHVIEELINIPYGATVSYKQIGDNIKKKTNMEVSYQAIGTAIKHNPILIMIPCHRVIKNNGLIGNYSGGIVLKKFLIDLEKQ